MSKTIDEQPLTQLCYYCGGDEIVRVKRIIGNGAYQVFDLCLSCNRNARKTHLFGHREDDERLPVYADYTVNMPPCERCGSRVGVELHHWAPQHVFPLDAETWPKAYLCRKCHSEWHATMNSHYYECKVCDRMYNHERQSEVSPVLRRPRLVRVPRSLPGRRALRLRQARLQKPRQAPGPGPRIERGIHRPGAD